MLTGYLKPEYELSARIICEGILVGSLHNDIDLKGSILAENQLSGRLLINTEYSDYTGSYNVTPTVHGETMKTSDKHMLDDINILAIPYYEVSDDFGKTIIIGEN